jgi:hypothetical protein
LIVEPCEPAIDEVRLKYRAAVSEVILSIIAEGQAQHVLRRDIPADVAATVRRPSFAFRLSPRRRHPEVTHLVMGH